MKIGTHSQLSRMNTTVHEPAHTHIHAGLQRGCHTSTPVKANGVLNARLLLTGASRRFAPRTAHTPRPSYIHVHILCRGCACERLKRIVAAGSNACERVSAFCACDCVCEYSAPREYREFLTPVLARRECLSVCRVGGGRATAWLVRGNRNLSTIAQGVIRTSCCTFLFYVLPMLLKLM